MAFDKATRNALARMVGGARERLARDITEQLQTHYRLQPDGTALPLDGLVEDRLATARELHAWQAHLAAQESGDESTRRARAFERMVREIGFTVLNRLAALRLCEERGLLVECVGQGMASEGFRVYDQLTGGALGSRYATYCAFLESLFDELALDLGVLFDRQTPASRVFPSERALEDVLALLNEPALRDLWSEDETIGWIYQYYNDPAERKLMREQSSAPRNSRELAVRNQFFTPRYVVEFLTDNTLGRIWYEMTRGETGLKDKCRYLVRRPTEVFLAKGQEPPESQEPSGDLTQEELLNQPVYIPHRPLKDPRTVKMLDPACGSMHFGLYAFDIYECIYEEAWTLEGELGADAFARPEKLKPLRDTYASKEAFLREVPRLIIEHNIHGIDIDPRATQISGLSLWLRAQKAWRAQGLRPAGRPRIQRSNVVCAEPMPGEADMLEDFVAELRPPVLGQIVRIIFEKMKLAGEAGSLLKIEEELAETIETARREWVQASQRAQDRRGNALLFTEQQLDELKVGPRQARLFDLTGVTGAEFWEQAETKVLEALRAYAEQAGNGAGYRRRLFAADAARGFAFIDVCRQRYDAVLMNPPFGEFCKGTRDQMTASYRGAKADIYGAFIERGLGLLCAHSRVGAITSRTWLSLSSFREVREFLLAEGKIRIIADLGRGVLDDANVQVCAYLLETP